MGTKKRMFLSEASVYSPEYLQALTESEECDSLPCASLGIVNPVCIQIGCSEGCV